MNTFSDHKGLSEIVQFSFVKKINLVICKKIFQTKKSKPFKNLKEFVSINGVGFNGLLKLTIALSAILPSGSFSFPIIIPPINLSWFFPCKQGRLLTIHAFWECLNGKWVQIELKTYSCPTGGMHTIISNMHHTNDSCNSPPSRWTELLGTF